MKICTKCKKELPLDSFSNSKRNKSGKRSACKECSNIDNKIYADKNKHKKSKYSKEYRKENYNECLKKEKESRHRNKENIKICNRKYRENNKEEEKQRHRKYQKENKEKLSEYHKKRYSEKKEHILKACKAYRQCNKNKKREWNENYKNTEKSKISRANSIGKRRFLKKINNDKTIPINIEYPLTKELQELLDNQGGKCFYCRCDINENRHLDHYVPLAKGGAHSINNVVWSCPSCNMSKGSKMPDEFITH